MVCFLVAGWSAISRREGLSSAEHNADNGGGDSLNADVRTFWCKYCAHLEIYGVSAWTGGQGGQCGQFKNSKFKLG